MTEPQTSLGNALPPSWKVRDRLSREENLEGWLVKMQEKEDHSVSWARPLVGPGSLKYKLAEVSTKNDNSCPYRGRGGVPMCSPASKASVSRTKAAPARVPVEPLSASFLRELALPGACPAWAHGNFGGHTFGTMQNRAILKSLTTSKVGEEARKWGSHTVIKWGTVNEPTILGSHVTVQIMI